MNHRGEPAVRPMIALGQFRDTFIIAMDDEGLCIIDQHVAHERVLFERIMEKLTDGVAREPAPADPAVLELPAAERAALVSKTDALARFGFEVEEFGGDSIKVTSMPALLPRERMRDGIARAGRGPRGPGSRLAPRGCAQTDCRDHGMSRRREGALPADAREDASHPRGAACHRVLDGVSARPPGDAADHPPRDREELRSDLVAPTAARNCESPAPRRRSFRIRSSASTWPARDGYSPRDGAASARRPSSGRS